MEYNAFALILVCAGLVAACGAGRPTKYYQLTAPTGKNGGADRRPYAVTLLIGPMATSQLYRDDRIVYTSDREAMGTYKFHRWAEPAPEMINEVLLRQLNESGSYQHVFIVHSNTRGDYLLNGRLYEFSEVDGKAFVVRVAFTFELRDTKSGATVWNHNYAHDEPVDEKDVAEVVAAMDRNVHRGLDEVVIGLEYYFNSLNATTSR